MPRAQKLVVFGVLAAGLAIALAVLVNTEQRRTGTNQVSRAAFIGTVDPGGEKACVTGMSLPAGTGAIRVMVGTYRQSGLKLTLVVSDRAGRELRQSAVGGIGDGATPTFDFAEFTRNTEGLRGCFTADGGRIAFAGVPNGNDDPGTDFFIGGGRAGGDVSLEYLEPGERSGFAMIGEMAGRATLYRPDWYGPWAFYLAFVLALVALAGGVALLLRLGAGLEWGPKQSAALAAVVFLGATGWALITPPFNVPDEAAHYVYAETLARGELPDKAQAPGSPGDAYLPSTNVLIVGTTDDLIQKPDLPVNWDKRREAEVMRAYEVTKAGPDEPFGLTPAKAYTPLYYVPAALIYKLVPGDSYDKIFWMRLYSALLAALAVLLAIGFARRLLPSVPWFAPVAGMAVAFTPMFLHMGGGVSNDTLMVVFSTLTLLLCARMLRDGATAKLAASIGAAFALGYMAKPTIAGIAPAVAFTFLLVAWRGRRELGPTVRALAPGPLVFLGIFAFAAVLFGASGEVASSVGATAEREAPFTINGLVSHTWQWYLPALPGMFDFFSGAPPVGDVFVKGFFANFNALDTFFGKWLYYLITAVLVALAAGTALELRRRRAVLRERWPLAAMPAIAVAGTALFINLMTYLILTKDGSNFAQGRYLFPVIAVFGATVAAGSLGLGSLRAGEPEAKSGDRAPRRGLAVASAVVVALALLNVFGMGLSAARFYL